MNKVRITYLVNDVEGELPLEISEDWQRMELAGLDAMKHIRVVVPSGRPAPSSEVDDLYLSWSDRSDFLSPFDAPVEKSLRLETTSNSNWTALIPWAKSCGISLNPDNVVKAANWDSYFSTKKPSFACLRELGIPDGFYALKINSGYGNQLIPGVETDDLVVEAWYKRRSWTETLEKTNPEDKTEVGVLSLSETQYDRSAYGYVTNLGVEKSTTRILFHYTPTYRPVRGSVQASFEESYGLHPFYKLSFDTPADEIPHGCKLYAKLDLPKSLFVDKYQLDDLPRMSPPALSIGVWGETDLEKPVWQVTQGSIALIRLDGQSTNDTYRIPLHSRYERPNDALHVGDVVPEPLVFWACKGKTGSDHVPGIGFESIFPTDTIFHVLPSNPVSYKVPVICASAEMFVSGMTWLVVLGGALLIAAVLGRQVMAGLRVKAKTE